MTLARIADFSCEAQKMARHGKDIDYHTGGNVMGICGEGLGGKPHVRNYSFKQTVEEITTEPTGNPPHITTWINGVKIMEWQEKKRGGTSIKVLLCRCMGRDHTSESVRYRNIRVNLIPP